MSAKDDGGPAFPISAVQAQNGDFVQFSSNGMSTRLYLAAHAPVDLQDAAAALKKTANLSYDELFRKLVQMRLSYADIMIEENKK